MRRLVAVGGLCSVLIMGHAMGAPRAEASTQNASPRNAVTTARAQDFLPVAFSLSPWATTSADRNTLARFTDDGAEPQQTPMQAFVFVKFVWGALPDNVKANIKQDAWNFVASLGRRVVDHYVRNALVTRFEVDGQDTNGDGEPDAYQETDGADYDGDGNDDQTFTATATTLPVLKGDINGQLQAEDAWLRRHGR